MTLFDVMPALWIVFAFVFFGVCLLSDLRVFLIGCGGALFAFCPSALGAGIFLQILSFFFYIGAVYAALLLKRGGEKRRYAIALTRIDNNGGFIMYRGKVRRAYPRDSLYEYGTGDVLSVVKLSDGTLCAYRI